MNHTDAIVLILRQLEGKISPDEQLALNHWLAQDPEHAAVRSRIRALHGANWRSIELSPSPTFLSQQLDTLRARAAEPEVHQRNKHTLIRIAAVITLAVLASLFIYYTAPDASAEHTLSFSQTGLNEVAKTLEREYHITVRIDNNTEGTLRFTGLFVNANISDVLAALTASLPVTLEQHPDSYILKVRN